MRVLTVGNMYPPHSFGGYEQVWHSAVQHLRAAGHEVRVLTTDTDTGTLLPDDPDVHRELRWRLRDGEFQPQSLPARVRLARRNHRVLERHLDALRPDAVGWWSMGGLTLTLLESVHRRGIPAVAFVHDDWLAYGPVVDGWLGAVSGLRRAGLVERLVRIPSRVDFAAAADYCFVSESTRDGALGLGLGLERISVAHSGVHPAFLDAASPHPWRGELLYVGRLDPRKGMDVAVRALALLPGMRLTVAGSGNAGEEERLRALAADAGVADRVVLTGRQDRQALIEHYAAADAVLFPVLWEEPWGLVPLEAMGRGRPVVATGRGGSAEYLRDGENALLYPAEDPAALAAAVRRLEHDPALRDRLRAGGAGTAARHTEPIFNAAVEAALVRA